ncbi:ascorbate-specific transmembrane electron transporter 2 isoform X1 [Capsicum annuum]|uniref:ascorbate-specific transmembrane electron transporter 2 isoform X1 n=1 Tax=Capsicum annuum TaxID=4072 RepID=UPI0007BEF2B2|nr:ascorbate-specific transmembrane electron transporter 2 isoform X1 [Capsicum annuum]
MASATAVESSLSLSPFSLLVLARLSASIVALLVLTWALHFKTSFHPTSSSSQEDLIYAVLHPLLMVIGFILISGEAILVHRWLPGSRNLKKSVHLCLQGLALACGIFGIWTKFHSRDGIVANFYSLHSWMGIICVSLFGAQVLALRTFLDIAKTTTYGFTTSSALEFKKSAIMDHVVNSRVVDGLLKLLAQRRSTNDKNTYTSMACIPRLIHIWIGCSNSRNRTSREVDLLANKRSCAETLHRVHDR